MDWQVTITVDLDHEIDPEKFQVLGEALAAHGAAVSGEDATVSVVLTVHGPDAGSVSGEGFVLVEKALVNLGRRVVLWSEVEVISAEEADRRIETATVPELVSGVEAAGILGVSRQRVHQLAAEHPSFPPPTARLACGSIWLRSGVEGFARRWERKPGRPPVSV